MALSVAPLVSHLSGPIPIISSSNVIYDPQTRTRSLSILCSYDSYTWTVISFNAHVLDWSIGDSMPLDHATHYVVRHVGGYGSNGQRLDLKIQVPDHLTNREAENWKLRVEFTAMEKEVYGAHKVEREIAGVKVLAKIDEVLPEWVSTTWLGTIVGVWEL